MYKDQYYVRHCVIHPFVDEDDEEGNDNDDNSDDENSDNDKKNNNGKKYHVYEISLKKIEYYPKNKDTTDILNSIYNYHRIEDKNVYDISDLPGYDKNNKNEGNVGQYGLGFNGYIDGSLQEDNIYYAHKYLPLYTYELLDDKIKIIKILPPILKSVIIYESKYFNKFMDYCKHVFEVMNDYPTSFWLDDGDYWFNNVEFAKHDKKCISNDFIKQINYRLHNGDNQINLLDYKSLSKKTIPKHYTFLYVFAYILSGYHKNVRMLLNNGETLDNDTHIYSDTKMNININMYKKYHYFDIDLPGIKRINKLEDIRINLTCTT